MAKRDLRKQAVSYLDNRDIALGETATFFPNISTQDNVLLNGDQRSFLHFTGKEKYVFYSNVYNIQDTDYKALMHNYTVLKAFECRGVFVRIYQRR